MSQLNLAFCNGPGGEVIQLKCGICEDLIQNLCYFSALQLEGSGSPCPLPTPPPPPWSQGGSSSSTGFSTASGHRPPKDPAELPKWLWQIPNARLTCKLQCSLKNWKPEKVQRKTERTEKVLCSEKQSIAMIVYCLWIIFLNAFCTWRKLYRYHPSCIFLDWYMNILVITHMLITQIL